MMFGSKNKIGAQVDGIGARTDGLGPHVEGAAPYLDGVGASSASGPAPFPGLTSLRLRASNRRNGKA